MNHLYRQSIPTKHGLSFFLNRIGSGGLARSEYCPSITGDQLPFDSVKLFLSKLEAIKRQKSNWSLFYFGYASFSIGLGTAVWIRDHMSKSTQLTLETFLFGATVTLGIAGCFAFWDHLAAERQIQTLIDEENSALLQKGLKWYLPKGSETIELLTNYKFLFNQPALNDEEIGNNSYKPSQAITNYRFFFNKSALNDDDEIGYGSYKSSQKFRSKPAINDEGDW